MDHHTLRRMAELMASTNDTDAVMGLRGVQGALDAEGVALSSALDFVFAHLAEIKAVQQPQDVAVPVQPAAAMPAVAVTGMPQCVAQAGTVIVMLPEGAPETMALPGQAGDYAALIAEILTDALVAAAINKSRFKLKVVDVKNAKGEVMETTLRAEYEREGMTPVVVWSHTRGEVAALAAVLRKGLAVAAPDLLAP